MKTTNRVDDIAAHVKSIRTKLGLGRTEMANLLGMGNSGERTIRGWETGEHVPTKAKMESLDSLEATLKETYLKAPYRQQENCIPAFKFIDLFAGIGGIRLPFQKLGGKCVLTSEWDKFAQKTYLTNFGEMPSGDITKITASDIEDHDVLLAGFPCQSFSQAGEKKGFYEISGLAWSGYGKIKRVEVSADEGKTWVTANLDGPVLSKSLTRFTIPWQWNGSSTILLSRATDEFGRVQPTRELWREKYASHSFNHYNAIQAWHISNDGRVENTYV